MTPFHRRCKQISRRALDENRPASPEFRDGPFHCELLARNAAQQLIDTHSHSNIDHSAAAARSGEAMPNI